MRKLYKFYWDCGRQGDVTGLFVADEDTVSDAIGKTVYFGEILGKHSEVYGTLDAGDLEVKSDDQSFIGQLVSAFDGRLTISGHNPLEYINEDN